MHTHDFPWLAAALAALAFSAHAQTGAAMTQDTEGTAASPPVALGVWRIPIHRAPDDPVGGAYGTWAAGPNYKASFHDGFAFYPILGAGYPRDLPLRWRTESVSVGGAEIVGSETPAQHAHTDWRYEYRYPEAGFVEAYDVRPEGVEQTFVLRMRPATPGDLVITGAVQTELAAADTALRHGALVFRDGSGAAIVEYGAAVALDARGDRIAIASALEQGRIRLVVDRAWLADAVFPITIDPLTASKVFGESGAPDTVDVARDGESDQLFYLESRAASASDYDSAGYLLHDDMSVVANVWADVSSTWSTRYHQVAFVADAFRGLLNPSGRWVVALERDFGYLARTRAYLHDRGNTALNSGTQFSYDPNSVTQAHPSIGGTPDFTGGDDALIVYQETSTPTAADGAIYGVLFRASDPSPGFAASRIAIDVDALADNRWPCVTKVSDGGNASWVVTWQNWNLLPAVDWDIKAARVRPTGLAAGPVFLGAGSDHKIRPKVDGRKGRFLVAYTEASSSSGQSNPASGDRVMVQRFDWPENATTPTTQNPRPVHSSRFSTSASTGDGNRGVAFDANTKSHWAVAYHVNNGFTFTGAAKVARVGYTGGVVEAATLFDNSGGSRGFAPSACYNPDAYEFPIVYPTTVMVFFFTQAYGTRFQYDPAAGTQFVTSSCSGTIACLNASLPIPPYAGSEFVTMQLTNGIPNAQTLLVVDAASASLPLPGGCILGVGPTVYLFANAVTNSAGILAVPIPLPDQPVALGDLYWQFLQIDVINSRIVSTRTVKTAIR